MRLLDASPAPRIEGDLLTWQLGALEPSGERTVTLQLVPEREGELGSVAELHLKLRHRFAPSAHVQI